MRTMVPCRCLGDIFATSVWEAADDPQYADYTVADMYEHARAYTCPRSTTVRSPSPSNVCLRLQNL